MISAGGSLKILQLYTIARDPAEAYAAALSDKELDQIASMVKSRVPVPVEVFYSESTSTCQQPCSRRRKLQCIHSSATLFLLQLLAHLLQARRCIAPRRRGACAETACRAAIGRSRRRWSAAVRRPAAACGRAAWPVPAIPSISSCLSGIRGFTRMPMDDSSNALLSTGFQTKMSPLSPWPFSVGVDQSS